MAMGRRKRGSQYQLACPPPSGQQILISNHRAVLMMGASTSAAATVDRPLAVPLAVSAARTKKDEKQYEKTDSLGKGGPLKIFHSTSQPTLEIALLLTPRGLIPMQVQGSEGSL